MKKCLFILLGLFLVSDSYAAHYYRFWRGWKRDHLNEEKFRDSISQVFIPETVEVSTGRGLLAYLPVLPLKSSARSPELEKQIPDEIALVVYKSETAYQKVRNTSEGKAYGDLHWDYFDKAKGSASLVPLPYKGVLENEKAYDILESDADWQKGFAVHFIAEKIGDPVDYINLMKTRFSHDGLVSYIVLNSKDYVIEYQLWDRIEAYKEAALDLFKKRDTVLRPLVEDDYQLQKKSPYHVDLKYGEGLNTQFANQQKIVRDPMAYVKEGTGFVTNECRYSHDSSSENPKIECHVLYYDEDGREAYHSQYFEFSKTPTGKYFVVKD